MRHFLSFSFSLDFPLRKVLQATLQVHRKFWTSAIRTVTLDSTEKLIWKLATLQSPYCVFPSGVKEGNK